MNEFALISKYLKPLSVNNPGALKLADDIYFDSNKGIAISVDTFVEGVHFIDPSDPNKFLKRVIRASLSDLYCKGIAPKFYFLSFALNNTFVTATWLKKIKKILNSEQKKFNISIGGGDTTSSSKLVISVIVLGHCSGRPVFRCGAKVNDDIYVTGNISDPYLGLNVLKKRFNFGKFNNFFIKKYYEPEIQIHFSRYLIKIASSSIDISDGLAQNLYQLCTNSKCGAFVNLNLLPLSPICNFLIKKKKIQFKKIFSKGDDYQILFTSNPINRSRIKALSKKSNTKITRIGVIKKEKNIVFKYNLKKFKLNVKKMGYMHNF